MDFKKQITNVKLSVIENPKTYIEWDNTDNGRDIHECYERIDNHILCYVNIYNPRMMVFKGHDFFETLEEMYNTNLDQIQTK